MKYVRLVLLFWLCLFFQTAIAADSPDSFSSTSGPYQALECPQPTTRSTWAVLKRDGANRAVAPYLSSLGLGETGTGVISSPPFTLSTSRITFMIRGHDGQKGDQGKNYIALVDTRNGEVLQKTTAPGNDALQYRSWDINKLQGREARIELHDSLRGNAYAWFGIEQINAGPNFKVDFRNGLPKNWQQSQQTISDQQTVLADGIPFQLYPARFSLIPDSGSIEIPCGFIGKRLFLLGCTVGLASPLDVCGGVELHYASGRVDIIPLMVGFTLECENKLLSTASSLHLHQSGDPFQYYLPIQLRDEPLQDLRLVANPSRHPIPRISAISVESNARSEHLLALPEVSLSAIEQTWINRHSVSIETLNEQQIKKQIRDYYRQSPPPETNIRFEKQVLDTAFRSEGVAVADFNGDRQLDIAAGNQIYVGPHWEMQSVSGQPRAFPIMGYSDFFLCFADDINGDGANDLLMVGFPNRETHWFENPCAVGQPWKQHLAVAKTGNESPLFADVDGVPGPELLMNDGKRCSIARPTEDGTGIWPIQAIADPRDPSDGHGLGIGDVNGDGITDVLSPHGWWEGPDRATTRPWQFHKADLFGGAQLCVFDFDGDGDNDVLGSSAHGYGIAWTEQTDDGWQQHMIDDTDSQTHAIHLADIDQDGLIDFVTGKRFWAHNGHDPGSYEPAVLCWYQMKRSNGKPTWVKHQIDDNSGVGLHFRIIDINGDGLLDIITSNKKGVFLFQQAAH